MNCNTPSLQIELDVGDVVSGVDRLRDDIPLQQSAAVDVAAVRVPDHHPGEGKGHNNRYSVFTISSPHTVM